MSTDDPQTRKRVCIDLEAAGVAGSSSTVAGPEAAANLYLALFRCITKAPIARQKELQQPIAFRLISGSFPEGVEPKDLGLGAYRLR
jgi:hypothetical protein